MAVVLAGGGARRMGGIDKTALDVGGVSILERVKHAVATTCARTIVVGAESGGGPAAAVASVAGEMEGADIVVVVAGDLALLRVDHVRQLVDALEAVSSIHAAAAIDDRGLPNPLVAAYRTSALCATAAEVVAGDRADRLLPHNTRVVQLDDDATFSVNTPADLDEARRRISR